MQVKIGFTIEDIRELSPGIYEPENDFQTADIKYVYKNVGDTVAKDEAIFEVETDKAIEDFRSPADGLISVLYYKKGNKWETGRRREQTPFGELILPPLAVIETEGVGVSLPADQSETPREKQAVVLEKKDEDVQLKKRRITPVAFNILREHNISVNDIDAFSDEDKIDKEEAERIVALRKEQKGNSPSAVPAARAFAREHSIALEDVTPTGENRRVLLCDIIQYWENSSKQSIAETEEQAGKENEVIFLKPAREWLTIAHNLEKGLIRKSFPNIRLTPVAEGEMKINLSGLLEFQKHFGTAFKAVFGVRFRRWAPLVYSLSRVLMREEFRIFNGYWEVNNDDPNEDRVALYPCVNLGVSYDRGHKPIIDWENKEIRGQRLRIPVLHNADKFALREFFIRLDDLMERVDRDSEKGDGKINHTTRRDWQGHTAIFNNIGAGGHERGISLLTPKISLMLNMGVTAGNGETVFQVFFDHRLIDGMSVTNFMKTLFKKLDSVIEEITEEIFKK